MTCEAHFTFFMEVHPTFPMIFYFIPENMSVLGSDHELVSDRDDVGDSTRNRYLKDIYDEEEITQFSKSHIL